MNSFLIFKVANYSTLKCKTNVDIKKIQDP